MAAISGDSRLALFRIDAVRGYGVLNEPLYPDGSSGTGSVTLPTFTCSGLGHQNDLIELPIPTLSATGQSGEVGEAYIDLPVPTLSAAGNGHNTGSVDATLPVYECKGSSGGSGAITLPPLEVSATGLQGNIGKLTETLPSFTGVASGSGENIGSVSASLPLPSLDITGEQVNKGAVSASLKEWVLSAEGHTGVVATGTLTLPAYEVDATGVSENIGTIDVEIPLLIIEATATGNEATLNNGYVLNLDNRALTEYDSYPFNSMTEFNGVRLGASSSGIFALTGDTDNGSNIDAVAKMFFQSEGKVRMRYAYVNYRSDDDITLIVVPEESTVEAYEYTLKKTAKDGLQINREKLGRGIELTNGTIEIQNVNGGDLELKSLEAVIDALSRRV